MTVRDLLRLPRGVLTLFAPDALASHLVDSARTSRSSVILERLRRRPSGGDDHVLAAEFDIPASQRDVGFSDQ
jgi:hypothetical protein